MWLRNQGNLSTAWYTGKASLRQANAGNDMKNILYVRLIFTFYPNRDTSVIKFIPVVFQ